MSNHILLSLKPWFAEDILSGVKRYEYRNYRPSGVIDFMVIYETMPRQVISTIVEVKQVISGYREEIWRRTQEYSGTDQEGYYSYANRITHALELGAVYPLKKELRLRDLPTFHAPPRGYEYLTDEELAFIAQWV